MDLTEQKVSGVNQIHLLDSLNASILEATIKRLENTTAPTTNSLIIYVDKSTTVTEDRKQYVFDLTKSLQYLNNVSDEFLIQMEIKNNEVSMKTSVKRMIGETETGNVLLDTPVFEVLESFPVTLFDGENYIYTNYTDASIEIVYPKDCDLNRRYLNNTIFTDYLKNHPSDFSLDDIYFKDAFTKTTDKLNLEVNNLTLDCITSKSNKFNLDSNGNLIVNSITTVEGPSSNISFDLIYPVGSIYLSANSVNPSTLFGGTWESWGNGRVPVGVDTNQTEFNEVEKIGGAKNHKHLQTVGFADGVAYANAGGVYDRVVYTAGTRYYFTPTGVQGNTAVSIDYTSEQILLQPYITCYMWKRTA